MNKIKEIEKVLEEWKAVRKKHKEQGLTQCATDLGMRIIGLKMALEILKRSSNKDACNLDHEELNECGSLNYCPFCGSDKELKAEVYKCDRIGWEQGWEPSITCICGISFGIGFFGSGCDPDKIETMIVRRWNERSEIKMIY